MPATAISIAAILIFLISLGFNIYQHRTSQGSRKFEKSSLVLKHAFELRKKSQDLRNFIDSTDNVEDISSTLDAFDKLLENDVSALLENKRMSIQNLFGIEKSLLGVELQIDLLSKQVDYADKWNKEEAEYLSASNKSFKPTPNGAA